MRALVGIVIMIIGLAALVAGIMYLTEPVHSLPSFFPGYLAHGDGKHSSRGIAGVAVGVVLLVLGTVVAVAGGRRRSRW